MSGVLEASADVAGRADGAPNLAVNAREPPVGALTGAGRTEWAAARRALERSSPVNAASLRDIDSALFVVTLDDSAPTTHESVARAMLHGDTRNRWFDKCLNLIVTSNGRAGVNWEHAWGDGVAVLYYFNEVFTAASAAPPRASPSAPSRSDVKPLTWELAADPAILPAIRAAETASDAVVASTELRVYQTDSLTKADVKASRLSPDGVMQMALQLAHARAHGFTPSTYESASTAGYKHGRTETIRSATPESVAMCGVFGAPTAGGPGASSTSGTAAKADAGAKYAALSAAATRHSKTTREAAMGQGVDRHLFALQKWGEKLGLAPPDPPLFDSDAYRTFKDIRLSTSTLDSPALDGGGFGPVNRTSYGVGYGIEARGAQFHIMNYVTGAGGRGACSGEAFTAALESSLRDFHECIQGARTAGLIPKDDKQ